MAAKKQKKKTTKAPVKETARATKSTKVLFQRDFWRKNWMAALILLGASFALYFQSTSFGYVLDDSIVITDNQYTQKGFDGLWDIFSSESFEGYFGETKNLVQGNRYRPLSIMSFAVEQGLWGAKPGRSHLINIILYGLCCLLVFRVLAIILPTPKENKWYFSLALWAALLYLAHPLHSEAVANIKGRDEIMAMLFSMASLYYALKYSDTKKGYSLLIACVIFFLGLLAKENTITFLAVIPLTLWMFTSSSIRSIIGTTVAIFLVCCAYMVLRINTAGVPDFGQEIPDLMNNPFLGMTSAEKSATIFYTFLKYIKLLFVPFPLSHDYYPYAIPKVNWSSIVSITSLVLHLIAGIWALINVRKKSVLAYAILFYLITFSIVSNIVINLGTFMNERFIFMASLGFCIGIAYVLIGFLPKRFSKFPKYAGLGILAAMFFAYSTITLLRVPDWESALTLNRSAVKVSKNSARANSFMATALFNDFIASSDKRSKIALLDEAKIYADRALAIHPTYGNGNTMRVGIASERYKLSNQVTPLLETFIEVLRVRPDLDFITQFLQYLNDRGIHKQELLKFYNKAGNMLVNDYQNLQWGIHYMNMGLKIDYYNNQLNQSVANAYAMGGNNEKAQEYYSRIR
jgi:tetratricopeptide (TPR) repeat protein